jgi:hypothetical protein
MLGIYDVGVLFVRHESVMSSLRWCYTIVENVRRSSFLPRAYRSQQKENQP